MTDSLFPTLATPALADELALEPVIYNAAKIVGFFHPRVLSRTVGVAAQGTLVQAVFHRRASDGWWSVDILQSTDDVEHLVLIRRSPWFQTREGANGWLRYRSRKA